MVQWVTSKLIYRKLTYRGSSLNPIEFETEFEYSMNINSLDIKVRLGIAWLGGADGASWSSRRKHVEISWQLGQKSFRSVSWRSEKIASWVSDSPIKDVWTKRTSSTWTFELIIMDIRPEGQMNTFYVHRV